MRVVVDDSSVELAEGATLLDAATVAGVRVPTLCFDQRLSPAGTCRVCLVRVEGHDRPLAACTTPAAAGMVIRTDDAEVELAVKTTLELLISELPPRALDYNTEFASVCRRLGIRESDFTGVRRQIGRDDSHPYVKLDADLCIACGRCVRMCDEVQGTFALTLANRGFTTTVAPGNGGTWAESDCVACGGCVDSCPTGALSGPGAIERIPPETTQTTTCGYCGVGCSLDVHTRNGQIAAVTPTLEGPVNRGHACVKGRFAHAFVRSPERLTEPLIRDGDHLRPASWDDALAFIAQRLLRIRADRGPDAIAAISSARGTNEENYLMQKLMRVAIGTHNVDNCSRLCHSPSASGLTASLGLAGGTNSLDDLDHADCFLLVGANPTEAHPVVGARIKQRVLAGARLVVVDPRRTELARYADVHLRPRPGTNVAVFNGLAQLLIARDYVDKPFIEGRTDGFAELQRVVNRYQPELVQHLTSIPASDLARAAEMFGSAGRQAIVYGLGVTEHTHGTDGVRTLCNLALLTGAVGTDAGAGIHALRGQNNVQGASDMGALPDLLPGYQPVADATVRGRFEDAWGVRLAPERGLRIGEMFDAALEGRLRALHVFGEDVCQTDPDTGRVERAIDECDLVVTQEIFLSRTAARADIVLPAASFFEKDGTFVNCDRRFQRVYPTVAPPANTRSDFAIIFKLGLALGHDLGCATPAQALDEAASLAPLFSGISHARLDAEGPLHWPCEARTSRGEARLYQRKFATPNGRAQFAAVHYAAPAEEPDTSYPFALVTGRRLEHYNSGSMSRRTNNLSLLSSERLELHPDDAKRLKVKTGDIVEVTSRRGSTTVAVEVTERVASGQAFMAFHFPDTLANALTSFAGDEVTGCPEYKVSAVRISRSQAPRLE